VALASAGAVLVIGGLTIAVMASRGATQETPRDPRPAQARTETTASIEVPPPPPPETTESPTPTKTTTATAPATAAGVHHATTKRDAGVASPSQRF
jgi:hypothetical protein